MNDDPYDDHSSVVITILGKEYEFNGRRAILGLLASVLMTVFMLGVLLGEHIDRSLKS